MSRHQPGRRRRGSTAVAERPDTEPTGDTDMPAPALTVQTPESIAVIWSQYLTAKAAAERAAVEASGMEQHAGAAQTEEETLRAQAAQLLAKADEKKSERDRLLNGSADWRREEHKNTKVAGDLRNAAKVLAEASGMPDPEAHPPVVPQQQAPAQYPQEPDPLMGPLPSATPPQGVPVAGAQVPGENGRVDANAAFAPPPSQGPAS